MKNIFEREQIIVFLALVLVIGIFSGCGAKRLARDDVSQNLNTKPEVLSTEETVKETEDAAAVTFDEEEVPKSAAPETEAEAKSEAIPKEEMDMLIDVLLAKANANPADVRCCALDDYDGNGTYEGFIFVGSEPDDEFGWCEGTVYYVSPGGCDMVYTGTVADQEGNVFKLIDATDRTFILFDEAYVTALVTYVYYVENGKLEESNISRFGDINSDTDLKNIKMTFSTYDGFCNYAEGEEASAEWTGHTWKPYYFYYDSEKKDFMEYGATEISAEELKDIVGFDLAAEIEGEGYQVDNILRRNNGIVNVNYSVSKVLEDGVHDVTYKNATYDENAGAFVDAWDTGEGTWQGSDFGGTYMNALNSEMAVY